MESRLAFGDTTRSRFDDLLEDREPINPNSYRYLGKSYADYQRHFFATTPYVESQELKLDLTGDLPTVAHFSQDSVGKVIDEALKIPMDHFQRSIVTFVKGSEQPNVEYMPARMGMIEQQGKPALLAPSLKFKVPSCPKNSMQRLNSGYIIDVTATVKHKLVNNTLVPTKKSLGQDPFLLMPRFSCDDPSVVPLPALIDQRDKNVYFLILYNPLGVACTVTVFFHSFSYEQDGLSIICMVDPTDNTVIVKPKNSNYFGCGVYNLKAKVMFDKLRRYDNDKMVLLAPLFDASMEHAVPTGAEILFQRHNFFFSPRRRNWFAERLFAMPGFFARDGSVFLPPYVHADSVYTKNTHCVSMLLKRTMLFSTQDTLKLSHVVVNGGFANLRLYKELNKNMREIPDLITSLVMDCHEVLYFKRICSQYADLNLNLRLLADYECALTKGPFFDKLIKILQTHSKDTRTCEEQLFNICQKRTKSARLYACMEAINAYINSEQQQQHQMSQQSPSKDSTTTTSSNSNSNANTDSGEPSSDDAMATNTDDVSLIATTDKEAATESSGAKSQPPQPVDVANDDDDYNANDDKTIASKHVYNDKASTLSQMKPLSQAMKTNTDDDSDGDSFLCAPAKRKRRMPKKRNQPTTLGSSVPVGTIEDNIANTDDDDNDNNVISTDYDGDFEASADDGCCH